jgi:hypothetical protein
MSDLHDDAQHRGARICAGPAVAAIPWNGVTPGSRVAACLCVGGFGVAGCARLCEALGGCVDGWALRRPAVISDGGVRTFVSGP